MRGRGIFFAILGICILAAGYFGPRLLRGPAAARGVPEAVAGDHATALGARGAVASAEAHASQVGIDILRRGGNAVDAAVAVGFALGVTHPSAGNIGGGGFMLVRFPDGTSTAIDYRERAPLEAERDMYLDERGEVTDASRVGARAAAIPGTVAGLARAHERYGSLPWEDLVQPAVELAKNGWLLDEFHARDLAYAAKAMQDRGFGDSAAIFRAEDGSALEAGDRWAQPALARSLERIALEGPLVFYVGGLAEELLAGVRSQGGIWTEDDLGSYAAVERTPVAFSYRGHEILSMPPPSGGGIALRQILTASEQLGLFEHAWDSAERAHLYVEVLRRVFADRNRLVGDPEFVDVPLERLLDPAYVAGRMADIDPQRATPSIEVRAGEISKESEETTHFSVVDATGLAVANTYTLNGGFGAKLVVPNTGVILNNEMDDFTVKAGAPNMFGLVQGPQNWIAPGKRMLSSMTPTIVVLDGELRAIVGSPGGPSIITTVAQVVMQIIDHDRSISEAVRAPRIHHQWLPDTVVAEEAVDERIIAGLEARGHQIRRRPRLGHANCIEVDPVTRGFRAIADEERDGGKALAF